MSRPFRGTLGLLLACGLSGAALAQHAHRHDAHDPTHPDAGRPVADATPPASGGVPACSPEHAAMGHCTPGASQAPVDAHDAHDAHRHDAATGQPQLHDHAHGEGHANHAASPPPADAPGCTPQHAAMGHCTPAASEVPAAAHKQNAATEQQLHGHGHGQAQGQGHANHAASPPPADAPGCTPQHAAMGHCTASPASGTVPREPIPAVTEDDRKAAFPVLAHGHVAHGATTYTRVKFNRFEAWDSDTGSGQAWEGSASVGGDLHRLWLRSSGSRTSGRTTSANAELRWSRAVARWWDVVAGVRHDVEPGPARTRGAVGIQGIAPYQFEVSALAYFGEGGLAATLEAEYDMRFTNRLVLQPLIEVALHARDDPARGIGSGLSKAEAGLRLRYEITRRFAPYVGVAHERAFGRTARFHEAEGEDSRETRLVAGVRFWF